MLFALDMSVHSTHIVYGVECPCRGLHTLVMGLSAVEQIALHWCAVTPHYMGVCAWYWFGTVFGAESCGRAWEWDEVRLSSTVLNENGK